LATVGIALPVVLGKEEQARQLGREISQKRSKEWKDSEKRLKVKQEAFFLQTSPSGGSMVVVYFEAKDIGKVFTDFAQSRDQFDVWFKSQMKEITGADLNSLPQGPPPELLFSYGY
jgi:hypothetical protein